MIELVVELPFSRDMEMEADEVGCSLLLPDIDTRKLGDLCHQWWLRVDY